MKLNFPYRYFLLLTLPISIFLNRIISNFPEFIETFYSTRIYLFIAQNLSALTGVIPISLGEMIVLIIFILLPSCLFYVIFTVIKFGKINVKMIFINSIILVGFTYSLFLIVWGFNYHRLPYSEIAKLDVKPSSIEELSALCEDLIVRANHLRELVNEDDRGIKILNGSIDDMFKRSNVGFYNAQKIIPELQGSFGRPKGILLSEMLSYTGLVGIYFPFTAEANVNTAIPHSMLPSTTSHEMAHQRGFAREDEANFIAYFTCSLHPDYDFQYSGVLLGLIHSMNTLHRYSPDRHRELQAKYSNGLKRDLNDISSFWKKYEGKIERATNKINDAYLKSNLQEDGVRSYGRMVDLLLAKYREKQTH
ncbi:MAG: DUF3810 domain-containing protein [Alkaliphilus sp.]|nr:DUF3810 domain-containing protein [Alkaliphilus sp.]